MRIPVNWLKDFVKITVNEEKLANDLTLIGHMLDKVEFVNGNKVLDLELRGNRADCYSILGIAREISALYRKPLKNLKIITGLNFTDKLKNISLTPDKNYVKRAMMVEISNVKIENSPKWLTSRLEEYGIPSINNIVDLTNYVMIETGQPMHAFDQERVGGEIFIRLAKSGEKMTTFLGETIKLTKDDLVWANKDNVLSVAGAIGGKEHSITKYTKKVLLEAANYDRANIRRSVHRHNLFTDAGIRHEKELDPNLVEFGIGRFLAILEENKWGNVSTTVLNFYPNPVKPWKLNLNIDYKTRLSGLEIETNTTKDILISLGFKIIKATDSALEVEVPTHRTDVLHEEDLIEEVLRIYGYDKIPSNILSLEIPEDITPGFIKQEERFKNALNSVGFDEIISLPFVKPGFQKLNLSLFTPNLDPVKVENPPSPEIEYLRLSMIPNLIEFCRKILHERGQAARLYELGKTYHYAKGKYIENRKVGICYWLKNGATYSKFKGYLEALFSQLNIKNTRFEINDSPLLKNPYSIMIGNTTICIGGQVDNVYFAEINLEEALGKESPDTVKLWPKYPPQIEDVTINIKEGVLIGGVIDKIYGTDKLISQVELVDRFKDNYTFRVWYQHPKKTLTNDEIQAIRKKILNNF
jgi:phenylalanyl-tRNA synthetase beta chain